MHTGITVKIIQYCPVYRKKSEKKDLCSVYIGINVIRYSYTIRNYSVFDGEKERFHNRISSLRKLSENEIQRLNKITRLNVFGKPLKIENKNKKTRLNQRVLCKLHLN